MGKKKNIVNRHPLSKKLRFEVFKRDSFTCQYCGRKAPDVILHVDHITPVSKGGTNDLMNLVTACQECNSGKSNVELDDNSAVVKRQKQAEELQARREQIEMLRDWHIELANMRDIELDSFNELYERLTDNKFSVSKEYLNGTISKLINEYGLREVMQALVAGTQSYGNPSKSLEKIGGILFYRNNPDMQKRHRLLKYMEKNFFYFNKEKAIYLLNQAYKKNGVAFFDNELEHLPRNWTEFRADVSVWMED